MKDSCAKVDKRTFKLINNTDEDTSTLMNIAEKVVRNFNVPSFYLICKKSNHDGFSITNIDKPIIVITFKNIYQFESTLAHELVHLGQHQKGYASEDFTKKVVVTG